MLSLSWKNIFLFFIHNSLKKRFIFYMSCFDVFLYKCTFRCLKIVLLYYRVSLKVTVNIIHRLIYWYQCQMCFLIFDAMVIHVIWDYRINDIYQHDQYFYKGLICLYVVYMIEQVLHYVRYNCSFLPSIQGNTFKQSYL